VVGGDERVSRGIEITLPPLDRDRLDRLSERLHVSRSEVVRMALTSLEEDL
jgi:hypothetical protein